MLYVKSKCHEGNIVWTLKHIPSLIRVLAEVLLKVIWGLMCSGTDLSAQITWERFSFSYLKAKYFCCNITIILKPKQCLSGGVIWGSDVYITQEQGINWSSPSSPVSHSDSQSPLWKSRFFPMTQTHMALRLQPITPARRDAHTLILNKNRFGPGLSFVPLRKLQPRANVFLIASLQRWVTVS